MTGFRLFIEAEVKSEVKETLERLPKGHRALTKGYKFKFEGGCTLDGQKDAIGMIHLNNDKKKEIHVAAPWRYGREFAMLHEVGHLVYEKWMADNKELKAKWQKITNKTKEKLRQPAEELFCHAYANTYCKNKIEIHNHPEWEKFIKDLPS
jgi:hypothetical protein